MKTGTEIQSWEDICEALNIDPVTSIAWVQNLPEADQAPMLGVFRCMKLNEALNQGKDPYASRSADKTFPVFNMYDGNDPSGFGFSYVVLDWPRSRSYVGSRLSNNDAKLSRHAANTFAPWYRDWMTIPKK
jgi:hypothetical protein